MNKLIKDVITGITGITYRNDTDKIKVREYHDGEEIYIGQGETLSEALVKLSGNHWIGVGKGKLGFIYRIIDTHKRKAYLGRKQYKYYDKATQSYSKDTAWEAYCGSCIPLIKEYEERPKDFLFYKVLECDNRDELGYAEHMLIRGIFENRLVTGEYEYYNRVIPKLFMGQVEGCTDTFKGEVADIAEGL